MTATRVDVDEIIDRIGKLIPVVYEDDKERELFVGWWVNAAHDPAMRIAVTSFARKVDAYREHRERRGAAHKKLNEIMGASPDSIDLVEKALNRLWQQEVAL